MIAIAVVALAQGAVPIALLAWLAAARFGSRAEAFAVAALAAAWLSALWPIGFWFVLSPWVACLYGAAWIAAAMRAFRRTRAHDRWPSPWGARLRIAGVACAALACSAAGVQALAGRTMPAGEAVDLAFPLRGGTFVVANGGSSALVNAHVAALDDPRFAPVRGQSSAVDIVAVNALGMRARGLWPGDASRYVIFGLPVLAPCSGVVSQAENTLPDLSPPRTDPRDPSGNRVLLDCGRFMVLLAHLKQGSVTVQAGQRIATGDIVGAVGNSGDSFEPHLHLHAQSRGVGALLLGGDSLVARFDGRYLVRNDRVLRP